MRAVLVCLVCVAFVGLANGSRYHFAATLTGAQVVPPASSSGEGSAVFHYDDDDKMLYWEISYEGLKDVTGVHVHGPARAGSTAGHVIEINDESANSMGSVKINDEIWTWMERGLLYLQIHTEEHPDGALRGQIITTADEFFASLKGEHQRPTPVNTAARGHGTFEFDPDTRELSWRIEHDLDRATMAHIHAPATETETAGVAIDLTTPHSTIKGSHVLTEQQVEYLKTGLMYVNIHSEQHPNGAIRGQVKAEATSSGEEGFGTVLAVGVVLAGVALGTLAVLGGVVAYQFHQRKKFTMIAPDEEM